MGKRLKGVVHLVTGEVHLYEQGRNSTRQDSTIFASIDDPQPEARTGADALREVRDDLGLVQGASDPFDLDAYPAGRTPTVFFGSAVSYLGVRLLPGRKTTRKN